MFKVSFENLRHDVLILFVKFREAILMGRFSFEQIFRLVYSRQMQVLIFRGMAYWWLSFSLLLSKNQRCLWSIRLNLEYGIFFRFIWTAVKHQCRHNTKINKKLFLVMSNNLVNNKKKYTIRSIPYHDQYRLYGPFIINIVDIIVDNLDE